MLPTLLFCLCCICHRALSQLSWNLPQCFGRTQLLSSQQGTKHRTHLTLCVDTLPDYAHERVPTSLIPAHHNPAHLPVKHHTPRQINTLPGEAHQHNPTNPTPARHTPAHPAATSCTVRRNLAMMACVFPHFNLLPSGHSALQTPPAAVQPTGYQTPHQPRHSPISNLKSCLPTRTYASPPTLPQPSTPTCHVMHSAPQLCHNLLCSHACFGQVIAVLQQCVQGAYPQLGYLQLCVTAELLSIACLFLQQLPGLAPPAPP